MPSVLVGTRWRNRRGNGSFVRKCAAITADPQGKDFKRRRPETNQAAYKVKGFCLYDKVRYRGMDCFIKAFQRIFCAEDAGWDKSQ